ncbi:hypothetical protein ACH4VM_20975 [Streptomyces sp. NPDC020792]|uniref:hypothetical protein n=1 Tax=Streptomyces sp. NPDC020792 TaxID=3365089 RepID=UPI00379FD7B9
MRFITSPHAERLMSVAGLPKPSPGVPVVRWRTPIGSTVHTLPPTRLTNVSISNRIGVLDAGRIVQESTYAQLTQEPRLFQSLWELQRRMSGGAA